MIILAIIAANGNYGKLSTTDFISQLTLLDRKISPMPNTVIRGMQGWSIAAAVDAFLQSFNMCDQHRECFADRVGQVAMFEIRFFMERVGSMFSNYDLARNADYH
jgi:hypothetical protein